MMRPLLLYFLIFVFTGTAIAFENASFKQKDPLGWIQQPIDATVTYVFLASVASKQKLPVLVALSYDKKIDNPDAFLESSLKKGFNNVKKLKLQKSKKLGLKIPYSFFELSYVEEGDLYKGYALLIPQKNKYHLFQFTSGSANFEVFSKDVLEVFNSTTLKN